MVLYGPLAMTLWARSFWIRTVGSKCWFTTIAQSIRTVETVSNMKPIMAKWISRLDQWNLLMSNPATAGTNSNTVRLHARISISSQSLEPFLFLFSLWTRSSGLNLYSATVLTEKCTIETMKSIHGRSSATWPAVINKIVICTVSIKQVSKSCLIPALFNSLLLLSARFNSPLFISSFYKHKENSR